MASKMMTYEQAIRECERLERFIKLVEKYPSDTLKQWIIKEYALTNSLVEVARRASEKGLRVNGEEVDRDYVVFVIDSKPQPRDRLHNLLRNAYKAKSRAIKNRYN